MDGWSDLRDYGGVELLLGFNDNLLCDLAPMDLDIAREIKRDAYAFSLDGSNPHNPDGVLWITDHNFFAFPSS